MSKHFVDLLEQFEIIDKNFNIKLSLPPEDKAKLNALIQYLKTTPKNTCDEENALLRLVLNAVPCTISLVDDQLRYISVNQPLADLCQTSVENFIGKEVGFHTNNKFFINFARNIFDREEINYQDVEHQEVPTIINGLEKTFWISGTKLKKQNMAAIIGVDITTLKNLENRVHLTEKLTALGEMVAGIIHDIKSPLQLIGLSARKLRKSESVNENQLQAIEKIEKTTERILKIVGAIKVFARDESTDTQKLENIYDIFQDALEICDHRLKEMHIEMKIAKPKTPFMQNCYATKMFQVFVNLINNSIDAIQSLDEKWIDIQFNDNQIILTDSGKGIPEDVQKRIFEAFFTTKEAGVGSGLGLAMCKKILLEIGADININNQSAHTQFIIRF